MSINKYKKTEYVAVEYPPTEEIMAELESLNEQAAIEMAKLKDMLKK